MMLSILAKDEGGKMRKIARAAVSLLILCILFSLAACGRRGAGEAAQGQALPLATYLGGSETIDEVAGVLKEAGLSNTDLFQAWTSDFAKTAGKKAGLGDRWSPPSELSFDLAESMAGWEQHHNFSDTDCRMTAFLLMDGLLSAARVEEAYTGSYLVFDLEAIDTLERYEILRKNRALFTTLFGDKALPEGEDPQLRFAEVWQDYGIKVKSEKVSLLSIVICDPAFRTAFVGHTGVLVDLGDQLLFVEKIAFEQPYQATKVRHMDELLAMLSQRGEYFGEPGEPGPYVYRNGDFVAELKPAS